MAQGEMDTIGDGELLAQFVQERDARAFEELVRRHGPMVLATARQILRTAADVDDAFQATMLALATSANGLRHRSSVAAWLHRTGLRCAIAIQRSNSRWDQKMDQERERRERLAGTVQRHSPLAHLIDTEIEGILHEELDNLSTKLRDALVLCDLEGLPQNKAAQQLGVSTSAIHERLARGHRLLRERLQRRGVLLTGASLVTCFASSKQAEAQLAGGLARDLAQKAVLISAGTPAVELGISSTVSQLAARASITMTTFKPLTIFLAAVAILVAGSLLFELIGTPYSHSASAGTIFFDDFSDGSLTNDSPLTNLGAPVNWVHSGDASPLTVVNSHLEVRGRTFALGVVDGLRFGDVSIRTQARLLQGDGSVGIAARIPNIPGDSTGYLGQVSVLGQAILFANSPGWKDVAPVQTDIDPMSADVMMRMDLVGNEIRFWAWQAGDEMPTEPLIAVQDHSLAEGLVALGTGAINGNSAAEFRFIEVTQIPEPSTAQLIPMAALSAWLALRRGVWKS